MVIETGLCASWKPLCQFTYIFCIESDLERHGGDYWFAVTYHYQYMRLTMPPVGKVVRFTPLYLQMSQFQQSILLTRFTVAPV